MCKDSKECKLLYQPKKKKTKKKEKPWKEIKEDIFKRDGYRCRLCGSEDNLVVHHISEEELITVCEDCHARLH